MNTQTRTIAVLVALSLLISGLALAQNVSGSELKDVAATEALEAEVAARETETVVREAQRQAATAQRQAAANMRQTQIALAAGEAVPVSEAPVLSSRRYSAASGNYLPLGSAGVGPVLVIPSAEIEAKDLLTINEDINVMSRILEMNLQRAHIPPSSLNPFVSDSVSNLVIALGGRNRTSMQSLYLQGYGVLFMMKVDFPLSPPHQEQQPDEAETEEGTDKVWQDVRDRLYAPEKVAKREKDDSAVTYDAEKVEDLKTTLVESLKHAANIRNLQTEESVILTITGSGDSAGNLTTLTTRRTIVAEGRLRAISEPALVTAGSPTVLVIRAKKADIDSFAKGDLDLEQFRRRVQMLVYPYIGAGSQRSDILNTYKLLDVSR